MNIPVETEPAESLKYRRLSSWEDTNDLQLLAKAMRCGHETFYEEGE